MFSKNSVDAALLVFFECFSFLKILNLAENLDLSAANEIFTGTEIVISPHEEHVSKNKISLLSDCFTLSQIARKNDS